MAGYRTPGPIGTTRDAGDVIDGPRAPAGAARSGPVGAASALVGARTSALPGLPPGGRPTIAYGARGAVVKELQQLLNDHGAKPQLALDGIWGPLTQAAVRRFQRSHPPLRVDAIVGPRTWKELLLKRERTFKPTTVGAPAPATPPPAATPAKLRDTPPPPPADQKIQIVSVGFTDKSKSPALFGGSRSQYVNLGDTKILPADSGIVSSNQLGRTPPVAVKVSPATSTAVEVRLVREAVDGNFPAGSSKLSGRESGLESQQWESEVRTGTTNGNGELLIEPGLKIAATAGFKYKVQANLPGEKPKDGSNSVVVKRRIYVQPIVRYAHGRASGMSTIDTIASYLAGLDIDLVKLIAVQGNEIGVTEESDLPQSLIDIGADGLSSNAKAQAASPYCIAMIFGEFVADDIETPTFKADFKKPFPDSVTIGLTRGNHTYVLVPLKNGKQVVRARVLASDVAKGAESVASGIGLDAISDVVGLVANQVDLPNSALHDVNKFTDAIRVDLKDALAKLGDCDTIRVSLELRAIRGWGVGWAYTEHPVIYLNFRDPNSDGLLSTTEAQALVVHEVGHKIHLASDGSGSLPDKQPHHYPTFTTPDNVDAATMGHRGPHCSKGVDPAEKLWTAKAEHSASCTMWGQLKSLTHYCPECLTTVRKVDLADGF